MRSRADRLEDLMRRRRLALGLLNGAARDFEAAEPGHPKKPEGVTWFTWMKACKRRRARALYRLKVARNLLRGWSP